MPDSPIVLSGSSNFTIENKDIVGSTDRCIYLTNCNNVVIRNNTLRDSTDVGIFLVNCFNVWVHNNFIDNVSTGVRAQNCPSGYIRVNHNAMRNMVGPFPSGQFVQFNNVNGPYIRFCNNRCENFSGDSNPEDSISVYKCNGVAGNPIIVQGNWVRGGGPSTSGAGVTLGDQGGSYQLAKYNRFVNTGAGGIQVAGGHDIKFVGNWIYSDAFSWSHLGLLMGNFTSPFVASYNIDFAKNHCTWISGKASDQTGGSTSRLFNYNPFGTIVTVPSWSTNDFSPIGPDILPASLSPFFV